MSTPLYKFTFTEDEVKKAVALRLKQGWKFELGLLVPPEGDKRRNFATKWVKHDYLGGSVRVPAYAMHPDPEN